MTLGQRLNDEQQATAVRDVAADWLVVEQRYPGVDVHAIWEKALQESIRVSGYTSQEIEADPRIGKVVQNVASNAFHVRAEAAAHVAAGEK